MIKYKNVIIKITDDLKMASKNVVIMARIPLNVAKEIEKAVECGDFMSKADYFRQALREKVEREKAENWVWIIEGALTLATAARDPQQDWNQGGFEMPCETSLESSSFPSNISVSVELFNINALLKKRSADFLF